LISYLASAVGIFAAMTRVNDVIAMIFIGGISARDDYRVSTLGLGPADARLQGAMHERLM
jgi:hypothetical protein